MVVQCFFALIFSRCPTFTGIFGVSHCSEAWASHLPARLLGFRDAVRSDAHVALMASKPTPGGDEQSLERPISFDKKLWFTYWKWRCSIAILFCQRVTNMFRGSPLGYNMGGELLEEVYPTSMDSSVGMDQDHWEKKIHLRLVGRRSLRNRVWTKTHHIRRSPNH